MKQNDNDQNHKKESTPVVGKQSNGKYQMNADICHFSRAVPALKNIFLSLPARLLMLALLLTMTGCASVPPASNQARNLAISFTPPPQSAGVYIFRFTGIMGRAVLWPVCLDGCAVGEVADKSYLYIHVAPGNHNVQFFGDRKGASFAAEAGKNYCFVIHPLSVKPITEAKAKEYADKYTLSSLCGPEWAAKYAATQGGQGSYVGANGMPVMLYNPAAAAYNQQQMYDIMMMRSGRIP